MIPPGRGCSPVFERPIQRVMTARSPTDPIEARRWRTPAETTGPRRQPGRVVNPRHFHGFKFVRRSLIETDEGRGQSQTRTQL